MAGIVVLVIFFIVFALVKSASSRALGVGDYDRLTRNGVRGRALVLASTNVTVNFRIGMRRFERRTMTLDVELPGQAPYVAQGMYPVPRGLVAPVPGSMLDVAVDPRSGQIAVLGPGGFTGPWLNIGPPQPY